MIMIWKLMKWGLTLIGIWMIYRTIIVITTVNSDISNLFSGVLGIVFIAIAWGTKWVIKLMKERKWAKYTVYSMIIIFISSFLLVEGLIMTSQYHLEEKTDVLIVLGAGLSGETPSWILSNRLDSAYGYLNTYPGTVVVVSGGKGPGEAISEAEAMKRYLVGKGIDEKNIILEDKSTSTAENFAFSKQILDNKFTGGYTVSYVTNGFHVYRAGMIARKAGLDAFSVRAEDVPVLWVQTYGREYFAVVNYYFRNIF